MSTRDAASVGLGAFIQKSALKSRATTTANTRAADETSAHQRNGTVGRGMASGCSKKRIGGCPQRLRRRT